MSAVRAPLHVAFCSLLAVGIWLTAAGCGAAPLQRQGPAPVPPAPQQAGTLRYPTPRSGSAYDDPSTGVAVIASSVPGAGAVHAVVLGNVALLAIPSRDPHVHRQVAVQIRSAFAHIAEVRISTEPVIADRLAYLSNQIMRNRSIGPHLAELASLSAAMQPVR